MAKIDFSSYWIKSAFFTFFQRVAIIFFGIINFVLITRLLNPFQLGTYALFLVATGIFETVKSNLLKNAHVKFYSTSSSQEDRMKISSTSLFINLLISLILILLIIFLAAPVANWLNAGRELANMLYIFIPGILAMVLFSHFEYVQQSNLDFKGGFAGHFSRQLIIFILLVVTKFYSINMSLNRLSFYMVISIIMGAICMYFFSKKYLTSYVSPSKIWFSRFLNYGGYIFGSGLIANISSNLDQLMISKFIGPGKTAYYNVASRINNLIDIPSYTAAEIIFPMTSKDDNAVGRERVKYLFEKMAAIMLLITIPATIFIFIFANYLVRFIAGATYLPAAIILQLYMISAVLRPVQNQAANVLNSINKTKSVFIVNFVTLLLQLVFNYLFIKAFGFYGVAMGTVISTLISFIIWYFLLRKILNMRLKDILQHMTFLIKQLSRLLYKAN